MAGRKLAERVRLVGGILELRCSRCREWLKYTAFARRQAATVTGRQSHCRTCESKVQRARSEAEQRAREARIARRDAACQLERPNVLLSRR